jgi:probable HAF family extracellular repeat protein
MNLRPIGRALAAAACAALAVLAHAAPPVYAVRDIGTLGGDVTRPAQVNDRGMITGESTRHPGDKQGVAFFQWKKKFVGLPQETPGIASHGTGVNASGAVAGWEGPPSGGGLRPFLWTQAGKLVLADSGDAMAINDDGVVTGTALLSGWHAFSWRDGTMTDLGTVGGFSASSGAAVNRQGDIAGWVGESSVDSHAMVVLDGTMIDLGTFGGAAAQATGINAGRVVCGNFQTHSTAPDAAFVWHDGAVQLIQGPDKTGLLEAAAISDAGVVVGTMRTQHVRHAFAWRDGVLTDLNDALAPGSEGWTLEEATSINGRGEIVGRGTLDGRTRAFLLTPAN